MRKTLFIIAAAAIALIGFYAYFKPIFSVNGQIVFKPEFEANFMAATKAQEEFQKENPQLPSGTDLTAVAAQRILETRLVSAELSKEVDAKTLSQLLDAKINPALSNQNFMSAAESLYGLDASGVKKYIIVPQAEEDILTSSLLLKNKTLGDWLTEAKNSAKVKIYFIDLKWNGSGFVSNR